MSKKKSLTLVRCPSFYKSAGVTSEEEASGTEEVSVPDPFGSGLAGEAVAPKPFRLGCVR